LFGQIPLVWPFVHQRIADKYDPPLVQQRGMPTGTMFGRCVEQWFSRSSTCADLRVAPVTLQTVGPLAMCHIQCGEHVDDLVLAKTVYVFCCHDPFALQKPV